jgi:hypothetical protein
MPKPPPGEADLRRLAARFELAEDEIKELLAEAALGSGRRRMLEEALGILVALRQEEMRRPVIAAYLLAFRSVQRGGVLVAPRDLAASLHLKLDRGAQKAAEGARAAFKRVTATTSTTSTRRQSPPTSTTAAPGGRSAAGRR